MQYGAATACAVGTVCPGGMGMSQQQAAMNYSDPPMGAPTPTLFRGYNYNVMMGQPLWQQPNLMLNIMNSQPYMAMELNRMNSLASMVVPGIASPTMMNTYAAAVLPAG